ASNQEFRMPRLARNFLIAILTFSIGTVVTLSLRSLQRVSVSTEPKQDSSAPPRVQSPPQRRYGPAGEAISKEGVRASFASFSLTDGIWFSQWSEFHSSSHSARRTLEHALKHATQIIRREPLFDKNGRPVG